MLNRLPKHPGELASLLVDLGNPSTATIAAALGVSRRTVERWRTRGAPRMALLSLWWLSREGHSVWDCEMHNRTRLALDMSAALWREVRKLREARGLESAGNLGQVARTGHAANDSATAAAEAPGA